MSNILIIGGGVIGLTLAREFHKKGVANITILDCGEMGKESSFAAAGILAPQAEANKADEFLDFCIDSRDLYPDLSNELLEETGIDVELDQSGTFYTAFNKHDLKEIRERFLWQSKAGLEVERLSAAETHKLEPFVSPDSLESLFFPKDWHIENRQLIKALKKYAELNQITILENTKIKSVTTKNGKVTGVVNSNGETHTGEIVLLTAGTWTSLIKLDKSHLPTPKITPIKGQMMSFHTAKRLINHVIYSPRGYIVPRKSGKILAGATVEDVGFDKDVTRDAREFITQNALEIIPNLENIPIDDEWTGLRPATSDGMPLIGEISGVKNLFAATAHYRNGILLAPMTAQILVDRIIEGIDSTYLETFNPNRFREVKAN